MSFSLLPHHIEQSALYRGGRSFPGQETASVDELGGYQHLELAGGSSLQHVYTTPGGPGVRQSALSAGATDSFQGFGTSSPKTFLRRVARVRRGPRGVRPLAAQETEAARLHGRLEPSPARDAASSSFPPKLWTDREFEMTGSRCAQKARSAVRAYGTAGAFEPGTYRYSPIVGNETPHVFGRWKDHHLSLVSPESPKTRGKFSRWTKVKKAVSRYNLHRNNHPASPLKDIHNHLGWRSDPSLSRLKSKKSFVRSALDLLWQNNSEIEFLKKETEEHAKVISRHEEQLEYDRLHQKSLNECQSKLLAINFNNVEKLQERSGRLEESVAELQHRYLTLNQRSAANMHGFDARLSNLEKSRYEAPTDVKKVRTRVNKLDKTILQLAEHAVGQEACTDRLAENLRELEKKHLNINNHFDIMDHRTRGLEQRASKMNQQASLLQQRTAKVEKRAYHLERAQSQFQHDLNQVLQQRTAIRADDLARGSPREIRTQADIQRHQAAGLGGLIKQLRGVQIAHDQRMANLSQQTLPQETPRKVATRDFASQEDTSVQLNQIDGHCLVPKRPESPMEQSETDLGTGNSDFKDEFVGFSAFCGPYHGVICNADDEENPDDNDGDEDLMSYISSVHSQTAIVSNGQQLADFKASLPKNLTHTRYERSGSEMLKRKRSDDSLLESFKFKECKGGMSDGNMAQATRTAFDHDYSDGYLLTSRRFSGFDKEYKDYDMSGTDSKHF